MSSVRKLQEGLEQTETAQFVTTMLRDISATRLQSIRAIFEANQAYYLEMHEMMRVVKAHAKRLGVTIDEGTPKRAYVALTSNRRFYGHLNQDVMQTWLGAMQRDPEAHGVVVGQTGQQFVDTHGPSNSQKIHIASFTSDTPANAEVVPLMQSLREYSEVIVWHPTFINSFRQDACFTDITHQPKLHTGPTAPVEVDFIVEPEMPELLQFFKTQIRLILFQRVILETQVALTGARLMKMQRARERATELVKEQRRVIHKEVSLIRSMRLLETFAGFKTDRTV